MKITNKILVLFIGVSSLLISCYSDTEFSYEVIPLEEFIKGDYKFKTENEAILGIKSMKYEKHNDIIYVPIYMTSGGGKEFDKKILIKKDTLFLSVQLKPSSTGEVTEEKLIYFFEYNYQLKEGDVINEVVFVHPNYKRKK